MLALSETCRTAPGHVGNYFGPPFGSNQFHQTRTRMGRTANRPWIHSGFVPQLPTLDSKHSEHAGQSHMDTPKRGCGSASLAFSWVKQLGKVSDTGSRILRAMSGVSSLHSQTERIWVTVDSAFTLGQALLPQDVSRSHAQRSGRKSQICTQHKNVASFRSVTIKSRSQLRSDPDE